MIWNAKKHSGVGGYDKPPINPYTLRNGSTDDPTNLSTFDVAAAQIGKTATLKVKDHEGFVSCEVVGVGIAFGGTGLFGVDLDNVVGEDDILGRIRTREAAEIVEKLSSYTEVSPSGQGIHIICEGSLPENMGSKVARKKPDALTPSSNKAEYQLFDSGYMTVSGDVADDYPVEERTAQIAEVYDNFFREVAPIETLSRERPSRSRPRVSSPVVSSGYTRERWLEEVRRLSDAEVLERIFCSGSTGARVKALFDGDTSSQGGDHSAADLALCSYLYGFTDDLDMTERLFRASGLYRSTGKSRNYLQRTLNKATDKSQPLIGHIVFTADEKRAYAKKKQLEEDFARRNARHNSRTEREGKRNDRRKI